MKRKLTGTEWVAVGVVMPLLAALLVLGGIVAVFVILFAIALLSA